LLGSFGWVLTLGHPPFDSKEIAMIRRPHLVPYLSLSQTTNPAADYGELRHPRLACIVNNAVAPHH